MHLLKIALLLGSILCGVLSVTDDEFQVNHQQILFSYFFLSFERGGQIQGQKSFCAVIADLNGPWRRAPPQISRKTGVPEA